VKRIAAAVLLLPLAGTTLAQVTGVQRGPAERPVLPGFRAEPALPGFTLPPAPLFPEARSPDMLKTVITRFRVTGSTVWPAAELEAMLARYAGRPLDSDDIEEARLALTQRYITAGYINSGAVIPDQDLRDGVLEIRIVEGRLTGIVVGGENGFRDGFIRERMALGAGQPLNLLQLQERMQVLLQNPQIERINAELAPGVRPGEAQLKLDVVEAKRNLFAFAVANNRSPSVGAERGEVQMAWRNALGLGESWGLRFGASGGQEELFANFAVPVNAYDTLLMLKYEKNDTRVVEKPFDLIDITNRSTNVEFGFGHPVVRNAAREIFLSANLVKRNNESFLLGDSFSFIPGLPDGKNTVVALRLAADWSERSADQVLAARFMLSQGLDTLGATVNPGFADSLFTSRLVQAQWARRLGAQLGQVIVRADWQRANGALLPSEKFAVGGMQSVRGYRENALVRDHGEVLSAEYRHPVGRIQASELGSGPDDGGVELAVFADAGKSRDDGGRAQKLSSWGLGLRWTPAAGMLAQLYKGFAQQKLVTPTTTPSDRGIHFLFSLSAPF